MKHKEMPKRICIYKITSPIGKVYIGKTKDYYYRIRQHKAAINSRKFILYESFYKFGFDNHVFDIVEECSPELLNTRERYWQDHYNSNVEGLNMSLTGTDELSCVDHSTTTEKKRANNLGKKLSENAKSLITGELHGKAKLVLNTETGIYYGCLKDACEFHDLNYRRVRNYFKKNEKRKNKTSLIYV